MGKEFGPPKQINDARCSCCRYSLTPSSQVDDFCSGALGEKFVDGYNYFPYDATTSAVASTESRRPDFGCGHLFQAPTDECNEDISFTRVEIIGAYSLDNACSPVVIWQ
jgi:hypothetical protein